MTKKPNRSLGRLLMASVIVMIGVTAVAATSTVFAGGGVGGSAFVATDDDGTDGVLIFNTAPGETTEAPQITTSTTDVTVSSTTTAPVEIVEAPTTTLPTVTTVLITPDPGLHDIPAITTPIGYEVLDRWTDGPSRVTIWAAASADASREDLEAFVAQGLGTWVTIESGVSEGAIWARLIHASHPWCIWVEVYATAAGRERLQREADLHGPQFLVAESPFCSVQPGAFA